jgi:hypothetical protein
MAGGCSQRLEGRTSTIMAGRYNPTASIAS